MNERGDWAGGGIYSVLKCILKGKAGRLKMPTFNYSCDTSEYVSTDFFDADGSLTKIFLDYRFSVPLKTGEKERIFK